jgi:hypothetical protein
VLAAAAAVVVAARNGTVQISGETLLVMSRSAVVCGLVASRRPSNPIGWLILAAPLAAGASALAEELSVYGLVTALGSVPFASVIGGSRSRPECSRLQGLIDRRDRLTRPARAPPDRPARRA